MTDDTDDSKPKSKLKPVSSIKPSQRKLLDAAAVIWGESQTRKDAAFMARELVQCSLPHKNPGNVPLWKRKNGNVSLAIQPGMNIKTEESYGYPYGTIPRLLLYWIITEAVRTKSPRLELGHSLRGFMAELGLDPSRGGKRSDASRLKDQMERLFRSRFSFERRHEGDGRHGVTWLDMQVAPKGEFWWSERDPEQAALWGSWVELGHDFYMAITAAPVPVDMRALRALKKSPLALDLYAWLAYEAFRAYKSGKSRFETWEQLHDHIGGEYADIDNFRKKAKAALAKIRVVYPALKLGRKLGGIEVLPESFPALQPRNMTIEGEWTTL